MSTDKSEKRMSRETLGPLLAFLLTYFALGAYVAWSAWNATSVTQPAAAIAGGDAQPGVAVRIDSVAPGTIVRVDEPVGLLVFGGGYGEGTTALVNGAPPETARVLSTGQLYVELTQEEQRSATRLAISVRTGDSTAFVSSNVVVVSSGNADLTRLRWRIWAFGARTLDITQETRFLILTLLMGSLGGVIASLQSLGSYRGDDRLFGSWTVHYLVSPFVAGGIALFLYFTFRAGFLSGTAVTVEPGLLPWGLLALASLGGLFYDRSFVKLRELFLTLFRTDDRRSGKLDPAEEPDAERAVEGEGEGEEGEVLDEPPVPPEITTKKLPAAVVGQPYETRLEAKGEPAGLSWSVTPELPGGLQLHPGTGAISGTPAEAVTVRTYVFAAENLLGARTSTSLDLGVTP